MAILDDFRTAVRQAGHGAEVAQLLELALPPRGLRLEEPRVYAATAAYQEREARRAALGLGNHHPSVEPDVEQRAYVVAPVAPGSGWSCRDMTRALSAAATTHLISPEPNGATAKDARREAEHPRRSQAAERRAGEVRQAAEVEEMRTASCRRTAEVERSAERAGEREPVR